MDKIEGKIETLSFGGRGILRDDRVYFVPFTAIGDVVECRVTGIKKNYGEAEVLKILQPSPDRTSPRCPYFGTCGGCQLQHLTYAAQSQYKRKAVDDAISRVYPGIEVTIHPSQLQWNYRTHVTLTFSPSHCGYYALDNCSLIDIKQCPIFVDETDPILTLVSKLSKEFKSTGKVKILKENNQKYLLSFHFYKIPSNFSSLAHQYLIDPIIGILGSSKGKSLSFGKATLQFSIDGKDFTTDPNAFLQAHPEASAEIYQRIKHYFSELKAQALLDLYCGIGVSTRFVSPFAESIIGVEWNRNAIKWAKNNVPFPHVKFEAADVEKILPSLLEKKPDAAILNPPREGLSKRVSTLLSESTIKNMVYLSCHPATLSRDLETLKKGNFLLEKAEAFDMFPQTGHIETLVYLHRS